MSENKFELIIENGVVTGYKGESKVVEIPEGVTEISKGAFQDCEFIEEVYSKSTVLKTIGDSAFENCKNLKVCKLDALKGSIENSAFCGCEKLKSFEVPDGTIKIGGGAFERCDSLIYVIIPSSVFVLDSYIFDVDNKKTVILGKFDSEAEEYAKSNMMPFKENTLFVRSEFAQIEERKANTGYKDFNVFGETVRCYKSVIVYKELLDFFKYLNSDFSKEVINSVTNDITVFNDKSENLINLTQVYAEKTRAFLQKYGVFISDTVFKANTLKYEANYLEVCGAYIDVCNKCINAIKEGKANLQSDLIAEAKSKVTGLSYGVIGDSLTMVAHAIDEYRARNRQINEAYDVAASKLKTGVNQIVNQTQNIYANLLNNTLLPAFNKSVAYVCDGLMQLAIEEMIESKVINKEVFEIYDIAKSNKLIEQAKKNSNIDKKYAIATALKLYPLNVDTFAYAIRNNLLEDALFDLIEYLELYKNDIIVLSFEDGFTYIELISLVEKYKDVPCGNLKKSIEKSIDRKAKVLINKINDYYDPMQIDIDTWNSLTQKYTILHPESVKNYNITEEEVKGSNGRELLSKAIAIAREEKRKDEEIKQQKIREQKLAEEKRIEKERKEQEERERLVKLQEQQEKEKKQKKIKTISLIVFVIISALAVCFFVVNFIITPNNIYNKAMGLMAENNYGDALEQLNSMEYPCKDSETKKQECHYYIAKDYEESDKIKHAAIAYGKAGDYKDAKEHARILWDSFAKRNTIDSGFDHIVSLKQDGSVVAAGRNDEGECNTDNWTDVIAIAAGDGHTVGLKSDGSVVVTGDTKGRNQNIIKWNNVVEIHACGFTTVGLKADGTVVVEGDFKQNDYEKIHGWTDIVEVYVDSSSLAGLKSDGTVVAVGDFEQVEYEEICSWSDISKVAIYDETLVGLKSDGTVVAVGDFEPTVYEKIHSWSDIIDIYANDLNIVGLKSNGMVVAEGRISDDEYKEIHSWRNVVDLSVTRGGFGGNIIGLKSDGTVVAVGDFEESVHEKIQNITDIVKLNVYYDEFIGLKSDGTVVVFNTFYEHFESLSNWTNIVGIYGNSKIFVALKSDGTTVVDGRLDIYGSFDDWQNILIENDRILSNKNH